MTISIQSTINKPKSCESQIDGDCNAEMKSLFEDVLKRKNELEKAEVNWVDNETVEVRNLSNLSLQSFLVQAEMQGRDISFTKQTIIKIA